MLHRIASLLRNQESDRENRGLLFASGDTVPSDGTDGYQTGCLFQHVDGGDGTALYVNEGSITSCDFNAIEGGGYDTPMNIGAFSSLTAGSGVEISSDQTSALNVYSDDVGANIGTSVRGLRSRFLLTTDQSAGTIRALQGQLKLANLVDVTTGIYTASQGYVELAGTHIAKTGSTFSCFDASLEIGTALTVDSGGEACGVHVETTGSGSITNNGTCAGILVDKAAGAADWPVAILAKNCTTGLSISAASGRAIDIDTSGVFRMGVQGTGVPVSTTYPFAMEVHCESTADIESGDTGATAGIYSRYEVSADQTSQCSHIAMFGKLRVKKDLADGAHAGVYGYVEISESGTAIGGTATTTTAAGTFAIEADTNFTLSTGHLNGVCIDSSVHASATISGTMSGLRIKKSTGKLAWETGIAIEGDAVAVGMTVGKFTSSGATTNAVAFSTSQDIYSDGQLSTVEIHGASTGDLGSGYSAKCLRARHIVNATAAAHETYGVMGQLVVKDTTLSHLHAGVIGTFEGHTSGVVSTPAYRYGTACVQARIGGGAAITATTPICGFSAIFNSADALAAGSSVAYAVTNTTTGEWDYVIGVTHAGSGVHNGVEIVDGLAGDTGDEGKVGYDALMKVDIGGTAYYIALFDAGSVTGEA